MNPWIGWKIVIDEVRKDTDVQENLRNFLFMDNKTTVSLYT
jgi:hypothetical protein